MSASQAILRMVAGVTGPVKVNVPVPVAVPGGRPVGGRSGWCAGERVVGRVRCGGGVAGAGGGGGFELVEEVLVADGDHDLGSEASGGREGGGGEGCFAGADEAVEVLLGPGAAFEVGIGGRGFGGCAEPRPRVRAQRPRCRHRCLRRLRCRRCRCRYGLPVRGVGGGVHDGEEVFVLVGGGEDFEVVESAAGAAEEGALAVAEFFFGWFGAVLVDGVGPAVGDAGQEVVVVLDGSARQGVFHPRQGLCRGDVADAVQGGGDGGSGAGGDGPVCQGGGGFFAGRGHGLAGDPGARQDRGGEGEAAAGFRGADP